MSDTRELQAKLAFDQAFSQLSGQRDTLDHLQKRARDVIGLLTLAATFLGAFGKADSVLATVKGQPGCLVTVFFLFPIVTALAALYVMTPRRGWIFQIDADSVSKAMRADTSKTFDSTEDFYLSYVDVITGLVRKNEPPLKCRERALWVAFATLLITIAWTGFMVWTSTPPHT